MNTAALDFIRADSVAEVAALVAKSRAVGNVPLVGDPRWSVEHWDLVRGQWLNAQLPDEAAWVALSSGSTGNPRLIVRSAQSWEHSFPVLNRLMSLTTDDVFYLPGSPASSLVLFSVAHAASLGARLSGDPDSIAQATVFHGTPSLLRTLLQKLESGRPSRIRAALVGGDILDSATRERAENLGIKVLAYYGAAELSFVAIDVDGHGLQAFPGVDTKITDGELWVRSPYRAISYLGDGGALREAADGWVTVGDLAAESEGRLVIQGRADGAIQTAGATVIPEDVEKALSQFRGVENVVVFGLPSSTIGNLVAAAVVFELHATASMKRAWVHRVLESGLLSNTHRPRVWFEANTLPVTLSGKPARKAIQAAAIAGEYQKMVSPKPEPVVQANTPVVVATARTPIATRGGRLAKVGAEHLAGAVISAVAAKAGKALGLEAHPSIDGVFLGNCMGPGGNLARVSALAAGLDIQTPAMTIDTQCASSLTAIIVAGQAISAGAATLQIAGGSESASTAPVRSIDGVPYTRAPFAPEGFDDPDMGPAAQKLAIKNQISRADQDAYAIRSHKLALAAKAAGHFEAELVPIGDFTEDDAINPKIASLIGRMAPLYVAGEAAEVAVTGGNSSRNSDGAAVVALTSEANRNGAPGLALLDSVTLGKSTDLPGIGPVGAVEKLLARNQLSMDDIVAFEIVEAFGAQTLSVLRALGLAQGSQIDDRVCAQGGSLAWGHPWGASGALIVNRLFGRMVNGGAPAGSLGLATVAVGGGMGVAALFKVVR